MRVLYPIKDFYITAAFLDPNYPKWRIKAGLSPAEHPGADFNVTGTSGNGDEGYPVVAISDGIVTHSARHRVWGNIVTVRHPMLEKKVGTYVESQYAHLKFRTVEEGDLILAGEPVGSIGVGDPTYKMLAHLHFEIRKSRLDPDEWGLSRDQIRAHYYDPIEFIRKYEDTSHRYWRENVIIDGTAYKNSVINLDFENKAYVRTGVELS